ncbi:MAG: hypothetical protein Q7T20_11015 [Saprospiraceae bacterium]|nr:hypothetical protein [Saprospiraceae bacterium]
MKNTPCLLLVLALTALMNPIFAQTDVALLADLAEENKAAVEALVLYPSETRLAILEATKHPEVLIKMQNMREKTSAAFRTLIEDFPRSTQDVFYDLSRYPGLTESLVSQRNDPAALRKSLEILPEAKRVDAYGVVHRQMATLAKIRDLNQTTQRAFDRLVDGYPIPAKQAFEQLLGLPEVIDLLNEDLRFTILVGETYLDNPSWVIQKTDSLNLAVARAHAEELENWKTSLENDPAAKAELESAAREYAAENGYDERDYYSDDLYNDGNYDRRDNDIRVHHYYEPYPYWYGYPWWDPYPRWYPYPWWWDWGYRFHPYGPVVIVYLPSYHFTQWYFRHPHHHQHYNHLSTHFVNHYYGHRNSGTTISMGVREWQNQNRAVVSDDFLADKGRLPERLKEYSRFEQSRKDFNVKNPQRQVTQEEFLDKNTKKYPEIQRSRVVAKKEIQREDQIKQEKRSDWAPSKAPATPEPAPTPKAERPRVPAPAQKVPRTDRPEAAPVPKTDRPPRVSDPKIPKTEKPVTRESVQRPQTRPDEAKDYNRQKWEERKPRQQTQPRNPAPASRPANPPKTAPKPQKSRGGG